MKIALTGAGGFIGGHIKRYAEEKGHEVEVVARHQLPVAGVPDVIIHCAAYGNYFHQKESFGDTYFWSLQNIHINYLWPSQLLNFARNNFCKFIYLSSSSVLLPTTTMYSATKMGAELLVKAFVEQYKLQAFIVRPASVTGPGEQDFHLIPKLIDSCINGTPMELVEQPTHDFIDVEDVVRGIFKVLASGLPGHAYNLSSGHSTSNKLVRQMVESVTGKTANITKIVPQLRSYDTPEWKVPNDELRALGFKANYSLMDSIERMVG